MINHCQQSERRLFLKSVWKNALFVLLPALLPACANRNEPEKNAPGLTVNTCDENKLPASIKEKRKKLGYVRVSPMDNMTCSVCALWKAPKGEQTCGGCMLFDGPVQPEAYCTYWAAKKQNPAK